jgi:hypothetical protein
MTYGVVTTVTGSVAGYDQIHAAALRLTGGVLDGLLLHVARETADGYQILEVWDTREQCERGNREVLWPLIAQLPEAAPSGEPVVEEFDPRGLILSGAHLAR